MATEKKVIKVEPEFVICNNFGDAEIAQDPFAEGGPHHIEIKEEFVEPPFEDFDVNEVFVLRMSDDDGQVKTTVQQQDGNHIEEFNEFDDFDDDFDRGDDFFNEFDDEPVPITNQKELEVIETSQTKWKTKIINKNNDDIENGNAPNETKNEVEESNTKNEQNEEIDTKAIETKSIEKNKAKMTLRAKEKKNLGSKVKKNVGSKPSTKKKGRPKSQEEHKCRVCDKCYPYASLLKIHERTHMVDKGHNCPICEKSFARADHLKQHIKSVHRGEVINGVVQKPSFERKCDICSKVFYHSGNLRKHMILHTGERPFTCSEPNCGRTFVLSQHLKSHQKLVHSDEKSFQCAQCGKFITFYENFFLFYPIFH